MSISPDVAILIDEIRDDRVHGASQLARQAAGVLKIAAELSQASNVEQFLQEQKELGEALMSARPAMALVFNIVADLIDAVVDNSEGMELESIRRFAISRSDEVIRRSLQALFQITKYGAELIAGGDQIMTHSYSSTVVAVLEEAFNKNSDIEVITTRSGLGRTGERIAQELRLYGMPVTFINDTALGLYMPTSNKVMVGADRVCADGHVVNGVGTYQLALAARKSGVPFYVLCEMLKFDCRLRGAEVYLEEKEPSEVVEVDKLPLGINIVNPYFDITPPEMITGIVTEDGLLRPEEVISYMQTRLVEDS